MPRFFLREDQAERTVFNFPDASKLTATKAELSWARHDLHGLIWQRFINAPGVYGERFRKVCPEAHGQMEFGVPRVMKSEPRSKKRPLRGWLGLGWGGIDDAGFLILGQLGIWLMVVGRHLQDHFLQQLNKRQRTLVSGTHNTTTPFILRV